MNVVQQSIATVLNSIVGEISCICYHNSTNRFHCSIIFVCKIISLSLSLYIYIYIFVCVCVCVCVCWRHDMMMMIYIYIYIYYHYYHYKNYYENANVERPNSIKYTVLCSKTQGKITIFQLYDKTKLNHSQLWDTFTRCSDER